MRNLHDTALPGDVAQLLEKWELRRRAPDRRDHRERDRLGSRAGRPTSSAGSRSLGVGIAIDDFGTGYTSLAYLARLAITQLKIDRSFVLSMDRDADDAAIVRSIITLGHDLDLEVVAEGVETKAIYDELARLGCDTIQGYWLSYPLRAGRARRMAGARLRAPRQGRRLRLQARFGRRRPGNPPPLAGAYPAPCQGVKLS